MRNPRVNSMRALIIVAGCSLGIAGIVHRQLTAGKGGGNPADQSILSTVLRPDGRPAVGVTVTAFALTPDQQSRSAVTDRNGECRFDSPYDLPRADFESMQSAIPLVALNAESAQSIGIAPWNHGPSSVRVSLKLRNPDTVTLKVCDDLGKPLTHLPLQLTAIASGDTFIPVQCITAARQSGETNDRGELRLERMPHGDRVVLSTSDPNYVLSSPADAIALDGSGGYTRIVRLHHAGRLTGELRNGSDGRPAAGVSVALSDRDALRSIRTTTDARGAYSFTRLAAGKYSVNADIPERGWYADPVTCRVETGRTQRVSMVTRKMGLLTIKVHERGGLPVPGVVVDGAVTDACGVARTYAKPGRHSITIGTVPTLLRDIKPGYVSEPGKASEGGYPSSRDGNIVYGDPAVLQSTGVTVMVSSGGHSEATVVLDVPQSQNVQGLVTDESGHAVVGALVHSAPLAVYQNGISITNEWARFDADAGSLTEGQCPSVARTDSEGRFRISRVSNLCTLWASRGPTDASSTRNRAMPGQRCVLELHKSILGAIAGKVVSADGRAIPNARVQILRHYAHSTPFESGPLTLTDRNGHFEIDSLPCGLNYSLRVCSDTNGCVEHPGPSGAPIVLKQGEIRILPTIVAPATPKSIGGVVKDGNGYPVASASVTGTGPVTGMRHAVTDRTGRFNMPHVAVEPIRLTATLNAPKLPQPDPSRYIERSHVAQTTPKPNTGVAGRSRQFERMGQTNRAGGNADSNVNAEAAKVVEGIVVTGKDAVASGARASQPVVAMGGSDNVEVPLSAA